MGFSGNNGATSNSIASSSDAAISNPTNGQSLTYDTPTQKWKNQTASGSTGLAHYSVTAYGAVGNGTTDDRAAIIAAISAASTDGGGIVTFPKGVFFISYYLPMQSNISLLGSGAGVTTIKLRDGIITSPGTSYFITYASLKNNITIDGIKFDAGTGHPTSDSPAVFGIAFNSCSNITIRNCAFTNGRRVVFFSNNNATTNKNILIENNYFDETIENIAIDVANSPSSAVPSSENVTIRNNTFDNIKFQNSLGPWTTVWFIGVGLLFEGNFVKASWDTALMVTGTNTRNVRVANNNITTRQVSIYFGQGPRYCTATGNDLRSLRDFAFHIDSDKTNNRDVYFTVANNTIHETGKSAIVSEGTNYVVIANNTIHNPAAIKTDTGANQNPNNNSGIVVTNAPAVDGGGGGKYVTITGNVIVDDRETHLMHYGIYVESAEGLTSIGNNVVNGFEVAAIRDAGTQYAQVIT